MSDFCPASENCQKLLRTVEKSKKKKSNKNLDRKLIYSSMSATVPAPFLDIFKKKYFLLNMDLWQSNNLYFTLDRNNYVFWIVFLSKCRPFQKKVVKTENFDLIHNLFRFSYGTDFGCFFTIRVKNYSIYNILWDKIARPHESQRGLILSVRNMFFRRIFSKL